MERFICKSILWPTEVERMWRQLPAGINGGVCYTEGFYDDVNKAVIASLMYDGSLTTRDIFVDYCGYEFRGELSDDFWTMCNLMDRCAGVLQFADQHSA